MMVRGSFLYPVLLRDMGEYIRINANGLGKPGDARLSIHVGRLWNFFGQVVTPP
jgi:hypothetical protein